MTSEEVWKAVFPWLDVLDLASCMAVSKQWRKIARDDYYWKCMCAKRWPSICKRPNPPSSSYYQICQNFHKPQQCRARLPPRISFEDLEFFIDIWIEDRLLFSDVQIGIKIPSPGICDMLRIHLESPDYKMTLPIEPRFTVPLSQTVTVSVLVGRNDSNKLACIFNKSMFDLIDRTAKRALAFDYLEFSPIYPFLSGIRAWISLLFMDEGSKGAIEVFGIEMDFCDAANSKEEVLWLLDMLDWK